MERRKIGKRVREGDRHELRSDDIARRVRQPFDSGSAVGLTDGELLWCFAGRSRASGSNHDTASAEVAFETLVARHGTMVLSLCRQILAVFTSGNWHRGRWSRGWNYLKRTRHTTSPIPPTGDSWLLAAVEALAILAIK